jgi:GNAT superfamily N-acetyltransferase
MRRVVDTAAAPPGVLAYVDGEPVGWCAVAPRDEFKRLDRSNATRRVDDRPAWSVVCFYVLRKARGRGVSRALLRAAVELAVAHGATTVEGYPVEGTRNFYRGVRSVFDDTGFREVARRVSNRPIVRYDAGARVKRRV